MDLADWRLADFVLTLVVALVVGAIGQATSRYKSGGWLVMTGMSLVGTFIGVWLARHYDFTMLLPLTWQGTTYPLLYAMLGAAFGVGIAGLFTKSR
jgi:uncharacterized membrane protein YeaQ/YmgE (transglycosylase-associated protein family)